MSALDDAIRAGLSSPAAKTRDERLTAAAVSLATLGQELIAALNSAGVPSSPAHFTEVIYGGEYGSDTYIAHDAGRAWPLQVFALRDDGTLYYYTPPLSVPDGNYRADVALTHPAYLTLVEDGPSANDMVAAAPSGQLRLMTTPHRVPGIQGRAISLGLAAKFPVGTKDRPADYPLDEVLGHAIADLIRFYA